MGPTMDIQVSSGHRQAAESLTGRIPIFLQALAEVKAQELVPAPQLDGDERWGQLMERFLETEPVAAMRRDIAGFYSQTSKRLKSPHSGSWRW